VTAVQDDTRPVLVAVSPTTGSPDALRWAATEARRRGVAVRAVSAFRAPRTGVSSAGRPPASAPPDPTETARTARSVLEAAVRRVLGDGVPVDCEAVPGRPSGVLRAASAGAQLLVLGAPRSRTARTGLVALQLAHRADCPVVTMPRGTRRTTARSPR
jgi:nucleotide-binding universal stress UspA family protein